MISRLTSGFSRLFSSSSQIASQNHNVKQFVEDSIANNKVIIFSKSWCPYCRSVKGLFDNFPNVKAHVIELDERQDGDPIQQYLLEKTGQRTVPNVFVNKHHIGGNDDTTKSFKSGRLAQLIADTFMARAHRVALIATIATFTYFLLFFNIFPVPLLDAKIAEQILPLIPWWLLIAFGSYSLWSIGWGLVSLRECPEAYNELLGEITEAKNDLRAKGVTVD